MSTWKQKWNFKGRERVNLQSYSWLCVVAGNELFHCRSGSQLISKHRTKHKCISKATCWIPELLKLISKASIIQPAWNSLSLAPKPPAFYESRRTTPQIQYQLSSAWPQTCLCRILCQWQWWSLGRRLLDIFPGQDTVCDWEGNLQRGFCCLNRWFHSFNECSYQIWVAYLRLLQTVNGEGISVVPIHRIATNSMAFSIIAGTLSTSTVSQKPFTWLLFLTLLKHWPLL